MNQPRESVPTFKLWRPVLNLQPEVMSRLIQAADEAGVPTPKTTRTHLEASILGAGELTTFHRAISAKPDGDEIWDLCEFVHEGLPDSADDYLTIPIFPVTAISSNSRPERRSVTIAPDNPLAINESGFAYDLLEDYYSVSGFDGLPGPSSPRVHFGKFGYDPRGDKSGAFTRFMRNHAELLPDELLLGPVWAETLNDD